MDTELEELDDLIEALKNCNESMQQDSNDFNITMVLLLLIKGDAGIHSFRKKAE